MRVRIGRFHSGAAESIGVNAELDIERLVESRAFIQASSGFGKSYLLCELIEATHGHIQQLIIDPEGEFSPLRKDHDFVIAAAHGGDAIAHPRTAALLATRLLETKASAILDIYDVKPRERHEFVRNFLTAMMEARKELWHPVLVFLDEAHLFCPEKGMGESEATDAVIDLAGRGRKRGFTLVAATQRIGKFNKSALAELHNKFIGYASLDTDVKRAAFELGRTPKDALEDFRKLKPGDFYAFGPALHVPSPCLFKGTLPRTKLPKAGHRKLVAPPKPTDKIRALLPQLADLPREVEQKAKTEAELRKDLANALRDIATLKRQQEADLRSLALPKLTPEDSKTGERIRAMTAQLKRYKTVVDRLMRFIVTINTIDQNNIHPDVVSAALKEAIDRASKTIGVRLEKCSKDIDEVRKRGEAIVLEMNKILAEEVSIDLNVKVQEPFKVKVPKQQTSNKLLTRDELKEALQPTANAMDRAELSGPERRVIDAIVWLESATGAHHFSNGAVAFVARYSPNGSSYEVPRSKLSKRGYINVGNGMVSITNDGRQVAETPPETPTREELHSRVRGILSGPMKRLLDPLIEAYPEWLTNEELAAKANYSQNGSSFEVPRSQLNRIGLIEFTNGKMKAKDFLFP